MTKKQLELRDKANTARFLMQNRESSIDAIMELYNRIPDIGTMIKPLFRYRQLNDYEIDSIRNETIFMRWPSSYPDTQDCSPVFDFEEISKFIIQKNYPGFDADKLYKEYIRASIFEENPKFASKIKDMRDMWMISCFTERYNNQKMWEQYANKEAGMCLVYNFKDILDAVSGNKEMTIMPVRYVENRDDCRDIALNHRDLIEDISDTYYKYLLTCTTKDRLKYSFEEEWRLIFEKENINKEIGECISFVNPVIIICGGKMDKNSPEYDELIKVAKEKGIEVIG